MPTIGSCGVKLQLQYMPMIDVPEINFKHHIWSWIFALNIYYASRVKLKFGPCPWFTSCTSGPIRYCLPYFRQNNDKPLSIAATPPPPPPPPNTHTSLSLPLSLSLSLFACDYIFWYNLSIELLNFADIYRHENIFDISRSLFHLFTTMSTSF